MAGMVWWPTKKEYDPKLSKTDWKSILNNEDVKCFGKKTGR